MNGELQDGDLSLSHDLMCHGYCIPWIPQTPLMGYVKLFTGREDVFSFLGTDVAASSYIVHAADSLPSRRLLSGDYVGETSQKRDILCERSTYG